MTSSKEAEQGVGSLRFGDVLSRLGYRMASKRVDGKDTVPLTQVSGTENSYTVNLERFSEFHLEENLFSTLSPEFTTNQTKKPGPEQLIIEFDELKKEEDDSLICSIRPAEGKHAPANWPFIANNGIIYCYGRFSARKDEIENGFARPTKNPNVYARYLKEWVVSGNERITICDFRISCPKDKTVPLSPVPPFGEAMYAEERGLFDEMIFGSFKKVIAHAIDEKWGYIKLPGNVMVDFPLIAFLMDREAWNKLSKQEKENQREKKIVNFRKEHAGFDKIPKLSIVPVLPTRYRLPLMETECQVDDPIVAEGYRPLLEACRAYRDSARAVKSDKKKESRESAIQRINSAVENVFFLLVDRLKGKFGILRRNGLGRRVDRSSRLVITPNPDLEWNQVGIPPVILWELMGDKVKGWLKKVGTEGIKLQDDDSSRQREQAEGWSWRRSKMYTATPDFIKKILCKYLDAHKDTLVLLNRQPSLHKDSFQAFHPVVLNPDDGEVFQLSPLCCKGLGADFDGDEMVGHYPVSADAQLEAARMLPDNNLLSAATKKTLAHFDQDFVMGSYWMSVFPDVLEDLKKVLPGDCCREQDFFHSENTRLPKEVAEKLLEHICVKHPEKAIHVVSEWLRLSLKVCSRIGVSFGFYDMLELARNVEKDVNAISDEKIKEAFNSLKGDNPNEKPKDPNKLVENAIMKKVESILVSPKMEASGLHVAGMAISGARGKKQVRQLIGARGFLSPGTLGYDLKEDVSKTFWFDVPLTKGMEWEKAFYAAMNARSSMCDKKLGTGHAGALTRKLVFALWNFKTVEGRDENSSDCHTHQGKTINCIEKVDDKVPLEKRIIGYCCADDIKAPNGIEILKAGEIITADVVKKIREFGIQEIRIRSVLTCECTGGVCAKCYGALPNGALPHVGYPAGLIAAQSIGERGTQLSMQSFHTGTRAFDMGVVRKILSNHDEIYNVEKKKMIKINYFNCLEKASAFVERFKGESAYADILDRHFEILWRVMFDNGNRTGTGNYTLNAVIGAHDMITQLAYSRQGINVLLAVKGEKPVEIDKSPIAEVLVNNFASKKNANNGKKKVK